MSRGRALGPGRLQKRGKSWVLTWTDEFRKRQRKTLSTDCRTAGRIRVEIIHKRDMALAGLGSEAGQSRTLAEITELYLEDFKVRVSAAHFKNVDPQLKRIIARLGDMRVRELKTMHVPAAIPPFILTAVATPAPRPAASNQTTCRPRSHHCCMASIAV